jgi:7-cyano-7-deazaguanine synthase in queuosine biosynthesis
MAGIEANRNVLLYSGGLDSFVLRHTRDFDHILYFNVGTEDGKREVARMDCGVEIVYLPLAQYELSNKIIPFRNYIFAMIAANWGNRITIGSTLGDTTRDKDYVFQASCETILNYFGNVSEKMPYKASQFEIRMPFKNMTKTEIVKVFKAHSGLPVFAFKDSRSCYEGGDKECGRCRACLRKYVAFANNGIADLLDFDKPTKEQLVSFYSESFKKHRHPKELQEIKECYSL